MSDDHANDLHEAAFLRVSADATLQAAFTTFRRTPMLDVDPKHLPSLSVFLMRDLATADGDANAGEPSFYHQCSIGVSALMLANDEDDMLVKVRAVPERVSAVLLTDPTFVAMIEGVASMDRKVVYPRIGDASFAEVQIEYVFTYRTDYPPNVPDDFEGVILTGAPYPNPGNANPIIRKWLVPVSGDTESGA
jgi:hypothetical protein